MDYTGLLRAAASAREKAYAPYSGFKVGAALLASNGKIYCGSNVENVSYGLSMCAERTALFKAVSEGDTSFQALAVTAQDDKEVFPCGACRQVLAEFSPDLEIITVKKEGGYAVVTLKELLPHPFTPEALK